MPSHSAPIRNGRVLLPVFVLDPAQVPGGSLEGRDFTALVDTGATASMISEQVTERLGLEAVGNDWFTSANGDRTSTTLRSVVLAVPVATEPPDSDADISVTTFSIREDVIAMKMPQPLSGFDVLIGMDVLMDFRITMHNGVFTIDDPS